MGGDCRLVCPNCFERLHREDIGHFPACPYCNAPLEVNRELENFLLQPAVNHWLYRQIGDPAAAFLAEPPPPAE
jgi:uncharacterized protein YbaR (Trm112 family)